LGVSKEKIKLIYPKTDFMKFDRSMEIGSIVDKYHLKGKSIILSINRLIERKGNDVMVQAMPAILKEIPNAVYVIGGSGQYEGKLREMVKDFHLEERVIFVNNLSDNEVIKFYKSCDVFVMPSRTLRQEDTEGFGVVFLEANACGKPVIGGRSGGIPEAVAEGYSGLLVDPLNVDEIARAVIRLLKDKDYATQLGTQGKKRVQEQFDSRFYIQDIKELMQGI
jgi:phosphatidylinositol alpha-1,6-mannosyltransferase